jgi:hypothetical protein
MEISPWVLKQYIQEMKHLLDDRTRARNTSPVRIPAARCISSTPGVTWNQTASFTTTVRSKQLVPTLFSDWENWRGKFT